jgi:UDP-glucose 4-epimerase
MIKAFSKALGKDIPYVITPRRPGDIPTCYADPSYAEQLIGFKATRTLEDMCRDALNWQLKNPNGYNV